MQRRVAKAGDQTDMICLLSNMTFSRDKLKVMSPQTMWKTTVCTNDEISVDKYYLLSFSDESFCCKYLVMCKCT